MTGISQATKESATHKQRFAYGGWNLIATLNPHRPLVKRLQGLALELLLVALALGLCGCSDRTPAEVLHRNEVATAFLNLSVELQPILSGGAVTSVVQLRTEYGRRFPQVPPLFKTYEVGSTQGVYPVYYLPARPYYRLHHWNSNDPPSTPMFWSYFHVQSWNPADVVVYLTIDGTQRHCSSNEFFSLIAPVSNRVERADNLHNSRK